jgi:methyl-CpG-binding domain protein 4
MVYLYSGVSYSALLVTRNYSYHRYAADAYAIFCAGKATEVVPKDHKLVDYWKYVCFELPVMQVVFWRHRFSELL